MATGDRALNPFKSVDYAVMIGELVYGFVLTTDRDTHADRQIQV